MMPLGLWVVVGWMAFVVLCAVAAFVWGLRSGQFEDVESAKYFMLEDREPEEWPGRAERRAAAEKGRRA